MLSYNKQCRTKMYTKIQIIIFGKKDNFKKYICNYMIKKNLTVDIIKNITY